MTKQIVLLGSTGSIGTQTLDVCKNHGFKVVALSAHSDREQLEYQRRGFAVSPENICLSSEDPDKLCKLASFPDCTIVNAIVGSAGLAPTLAALESGNPVALANKETLVAAGERVMEMSRKNNVPIIPIDSEHSAIMQCIGNNAKDVRRIILTASGGPFRGYSKQQLREVTREQALQHPNWRMGAKITVDSATLMNKGLELIEAVRLFDIDESQIEVVVHPQSIVHSAVEFTDGSVIAQLGVPDMRIPIQYALTYPERLPTSTEPLSLTRHGTLTFEEPDCEVFELLELAREAVRTGGGATCALNAANEAAVQLFLDGKIAFYEIAEVVKQAFHAACARTNSQDFMTLYTVAHTEKLTKESILCKYC